MKLTGAQALIKSLEMEGVEVMFGLPGGCILPAYDPLLDSPDPPHPRAPRAGRRPHGRGLRPRHRPPRRGHGDQRPGGHQHRHARCATPTWTRSRWWPSPARCRRRSIGTDAFQECDTVGITRSVTKHNELVMTAQDIPRIVRQAFHIATTGRPGPVLIDVPKDVLQDRSMDWYWPRRSVDLPGYQPQHQGPPPHDPGGGPADPARPSGRSSTPAAASSRPGPPRRCGSWPS